MRCAADPEWIQLSPANCCVAPIRRDQRSNPESAIESPILDRLADVLGRDLRFSVEISDGARDFQDPIVSAGAEIQFAHRHANQFLRVLAELAVLLELTRGHARVAINFRVITKTLLLAFTRANDALANRSGTLLSALAGDVAVFDSGHFDVKIDAVEQGTGNALAISLMV